MSEREPVSIVTTWFGAFAVLGTKLVDAAPFPPTMPALVERLAARRDGRLAPEEEQLLGRHRGERLVTRDRRLAALGAELGHPAEPSIPPVEHGFSGEMLRELLLARAAEDLRTGWDPTIHVQEAVRAITDLDRAMNHLGERLASWASHDRAPEREAEGSHRQLARALTTGARTTEYGVPEPPPALLAARRSLAELYLSLESARSGLERSLTESMPERAPNLTVLLGPMLAAQLISLAGSLERLSELPASTIQVLGAERAFFEHLRGRAPPPRHGILFLHPKLHSAPRAKRGRLARALAGKVAIAARLDRTGAPVDPRLATQFESRVAEIGRAPNRPPRDRPRGARSGRRPPLHRAAEHR